MASSVEARLQRVEVGLHEVEQSLVAMSSQIALLAASHASSSSDDEGGAVAMKDKVWSCASCAARLGIYDERSDELRVRYKDFVCYVKPGAGGVVEVPCRRCGQRNRLEDDRRP